MTESPSFDDLAQAEGKAAGSAQVPSLDTLAAWLSDPGPTPDDAREFVAALDAGLNHEQMAHVLETTPLEGAASLFASWPKGPRSNAAFTALVALDSSLLRGDLTGLPLVGPLVGWPPKMEFVKLALMMLSEVAQDKPDTPHPVGILIKAWISQPVSVAPETRQDSRILPVVKLRDRDRPLPALGGLPGNRKPHDLQLPLLPARDGLTVPILDLIDTAEGLPVAAQGRGAPLLSRATLYPLLAVAVGDRARPSVQLAFTVRDLRDMFWPNGWQKGRDWPILRHTLTKMRDVGLRDAGGGIWFPLGLRRLPHDAQGGPSLDDFVVIDVSMPPGAKDGPPVDLPALFQMGVTSGPTWRAYIGAHSLLWTPGKTRVVVPDSGGRWSWARDRNAYPVLTAAERRALAFGPADKKDRTRAAQDAPWDGLPGVVIEQAAIDAKTLVEGWRILPSETFGRPT